MIDRAQVHENYMVVKKIMITKPNIGRLSFMEVDIKPHSNIQTTTATRAGQYSFYEAHKLVSRFVHNSRWSGPLLLQKQKTQKGKSCRVEENLAVKERRMLLGGKERLSRILISTHCTQPHKEDKCQTVVP